jgi:hypothetical protein
MNLSYEECQLMFNSTKISEVQHITPSPLDADSLSQFIQTKNDEYESSSETESSLNSSDIEIVEIGFPNNKVLNKYDSKKYIQTFLNKNASKVKEKITCEICCGSYTYFNKSKHIRSKKHISLVEKYHK